MLKVIGVIVSKWENTAPNFITLFRFLLCLWALNAFYWWIWSPWLIVVLCVPIAILDAIDGWVARTFGQHSVSGKLLDPLIDKFCVWNGMIVIGHYFATNDIVAALMLAVMIPAFVMICAYDLFTMSLRGVDDEMKTNDTAKYKQFVLFVSLGLLLAAIAFHDTAIAFASEREWALALTVTHLLVAFSGIAALFYATRLTLASARIYFSETRNPTALAWAKAAPVRWFITA